jgi:hemolysin III
MTEAFLERGLQTIRFDSFVFKSHSPVSEVRMAKPVASGRRPQTSGEEIANSISSGVGLLAVIGGIPLLLGAAIRRGNGLSLAGTIIFAGAMVCLYLASTIYHALPEGTIKQFFHLLDHSAIYVLIAGTYTPFTLGAMRGGWGWALFGIVWTLAIAGISFKVFGGLRHQRLSIFTYLGMGWLALVALRLFWLHVQFPGLLWLFAGGVAYTTGVLFYAAKRLRYNHFIWHLFVIAGTACHFCAVLWYAG